MKSPMTDTRDGKTPLTSTNDVRDLRDPQLLGADLLAYKQTWCKKDPLSVVYDEFTELSHIPNVSKDDSMGKQAVKDYRAELEARIEEGDKYAEAALRDIDEGRGVQGFDDAG